MESLVKRILEKVNVNKVLAGLPIEVGELNDTNQVKLITAAVHCCLNGPVSVHKVTHYPEVGETSVDAIIGTRTTNSAMRALCMIVKDLLPEGISCSQARMTGSYWPQMA